MAVDLIYYPDGQYGLDPVSFDQNNSTILMDLGHSLEKFLLAPQAEYRRYLLGHENPIEKDVENHAFHYSKV